mgnify:CR=1 FL=1
MKLINIGFGNMVSANRLIAIVSPESAPIKRIVQEARDKGVLIDATYGRRTRAVLITDSDHVVLSAVQPETVANRLNDTGEEEEELANIKRMYPESTLVFILPPSMEELAARLRGRGTEDEAAVQKRLARAEEELREKDAYDFAIVNDDARRCADELYEILRARQSE